MNADKIDLDLLPGWRNLPTGILEDILANVDYTEPLHEFVADEIADRQYKAELARRGMED